VPPTTTRALERGCVTTVNRTIQSIQGRVINSTMETYRTIATSYFMHPQLQPLSQDNLRAKFGEPRQRGVTAKVAERRLVAMSSVRFTGCGASQERRAASPSPTSKRKTVDATRGEGDT
jgi:hypothetical protein